MDYRAVDSSLLFGAVVFLSDFGPRKKCPVTNELVGVVHGKAPPKKNYV